MPVLNSGLANYHDINTSNKCNSIKLFKQLLGGFVL